jgi:hypothetical protein
MFAILFLLYSNSQLLRLLVGIFFEILVEFLKNSWGILLPFFKDFLQGSTEAAFFYIWQKPNIPLWKFLWKYKDRKAATLAEYLGFGQIFLPLVDHWILDNWAAK